MFTLQEAGGKQSQPSRFTNLAEQYQPETGTVISSFVEDAFKGVGTFFADETASRVKNAEADANKLDLETYKNSDYYRSGIQWDESMTEGKARLLAEYNDDQEYRNFVNSKASTWQTVGGYTAAFSAGIFEPKNLAIGIPTAVLGGALVPRVVGVRRMLAAEKALGKYGSKAAVGGAEGLVSAALAEPSNRDSASILQQDYGMADTMWNIGLSTVLGAGLNVAPTFVKDRWRSYRNKADIVDIATNELDTATAQLTTGQKIDVAPVEKVHNGDIATKPITEKIEAIKQYEPQSVEPDMPETINLGLATEKTTPLDIVSKASTLFSEVGLKFNGIKDLLTMLRHDKSGGQRNIFTTDNIDIAMGQGDNKGALIEYDASYLSGKENAKPGTGDIVGREYQTNFIARDAIKKITIDKKLWNEETSYGGRALSSRGTDSIKSILDSDYNLISETLDKMTFEPKRNNLNAIAARMDAENTRAVKEAVVRSNNPDNDTGIDQKAARQLEEYEANYLADAEKTAIEDYERYQAEVKQMRDNDLLDAESAAALEALDNINETDLVSAYDAALLCLTKG